MSCKTDTSLSKRLSKNSTTNKVATVSPKIYADKGIGVDWQVFMIKNNQHNELISQNGIRIFIRAHTFDSYQSKIVLKEVLDKSEAVREGLNTVREDFTILESGGMIYLNAYDQEGNEQNNRNSIEFTMDGHNDMLIYNSEKAGENWEISPYYETEEQNFKRKRAEKPKRVPRRAKRLPKNDKGFLRMYSNEEMSGPILTSEELANLFPVFPRNTRSRYISTELKWINCDIPLTDELPVFIDVNKKKEKTEVYAVLKDTFSIVDLSFLTDKTVVTAMLPENTAITLVGIYNDESQAKYYLSMEDMVLDSSYNRKMLELNFMEISEENLKKKLAALK